MLRPLLVTCLLFLSRNAFSQLIKQSAQEVMDAYNHAKGDTDKIRILLRLDSIYLYQKPDTDEFLDSAVTMAKEAKRMSAEIHYRSGIEDATFMLANSFAEKMEMASAAALANSVTGPLRVRILIMMGERYLFRPGELIQNIDSASPYITAAISVSDSIGLRHWLYQSLCLKGKYYFALGEIDSGRACFQRMIKESHQDARQSEEAHWHAELGRYMPHTNTTYDETISELSYSAYLYHQLRDKQNEREILEALAYLHKLRPDKANLAEDELKRVISLREQTKSTYLFSDYTELSEIYTNRGNYNSALLYAQQAVRNMEAVNNEGLSGGVVYSQLAKVYRAIGDHKNSLVYFKKSLEHLVDYRTEYLFPIGGSIVECLLEMDSAREALHFVNTFIRENPPKRIVDKEIVTAAVGKCYVALGKYDLAERSYLQMIQLDEEAQAHMGKQTDGERSNTITGSEANYIIGGFYLNQQKPLLAKSYLEKALAYERFGPSVERQIDLHLLLFKVDSLQNNFLSAIQHLQLRQKLRDSIFNDRKSKQIAELQIQYATEKNVKDLEIAGANEKVKDNELQRYAQVRNITFLLIAALIVLIIVIYSRYAQKQKSNHQLKSHQEEIDLKNWELQRLLNDKDNLLSEKDALLEEKEMLVKEIHHRVKNNLQIVVSLLNTQAKYLNNQEAVHAISESRYRMQAMSLIHEKLYQSENTSSVNMKTFITELVDYLRASFSQGSRIDFLVDVDSIELNLSQAIPLGLIINEVITNSIKYAFPDGRFGQIDINMDLQLNRLALLTIRDNGVGFSADRDISRGNSMGMRLIAGLARQMRARMGINGEKGVCIELQFELEGPLKRQTELEYEVGVANDL